MENFEGFTPITADNIVVVRPGDYIKYHDGFGWNDSRISTEELNRGYIMTGVHNETARLISPMFGKYVYYKSDN